MDVPQLIAGRFRIEDEIGTGGMGTVYRATHLGLERPVAVKIIKPEFAGDPDVAERFLREARTMARLRHPHAAMIFDAGNLPDGRHFIVMEFVHGLTLSATLAREGRLSPERTVEIAVEICDVLEEAHKLGIIHRDLKPSNIMLNERGVCVLDFGVAKVLTPSTEATSTHVSTGSGHIVGTPRYMSPEQCLGHKVDARSDLYSLGVLLFEMLAGRPPFIDVLPSAVLVKQATAPPPPLPKLRPDVPRTLTLAVHHLLAKRPEDRPRTAGDARVLLLRSLVTHERVEREIEPLSSTIAALGSGRGLLFRIGAPLGLVLSFVAALLGWGYTSESATSQRIPSPSLASLSVVPLNGSQDRATVKARGNQPLLTRPEKPFTDRDNPSLADMRRKIALVSRGRANQLEIIQTESGPAIVAIQDARRRGSTHFFVMQKRAGSYRVTARGSLDSPNFRHAAWTAETLDADEDEFPEVLFVGSNSSNPRYAQRLVLYVPAERQSYSMLISAGSQSGRPTIIWSANAAGVDAAPYRTALRLKARPFLALARKR